MRVKGVCKDNKQPMGTGGHCCHSSTCRQRSDCSKSRSSSIRGQGRGAKWDTTKAVKDKMSAVVRKLSSILALHPETALPTFQGRGHWLLPPVASLMLLNRAGSTDARTWRLAGPREALRFSFRG
jgi:hypothetical protein